MQRPTFADPKIDFVFKRIFGSEKRKDILIAFLSDMLGLDEGHRINAASSVAKSRDCGAGWRRSAPRSASS